MATERIGVFAVDNVSKAFVYIRENNRLAFYNSSGSGWVCARLVACVKRWVNQWTGWNRGLNDFIDPNMVWRWVVQGAGRCTIPVCRFF